MRPPTRVVQTAYMSNAGATTIASTARRPAASRSAATDARRGCLRRARWSAARDRPARRSDAATAPRALRRSRDRTPRPAASRPRSASSTAGEQPAVFSLRCSRSPSHVAPRSRSFVLAACVARALPLRSTRMRDQAFGSASATAAGRFAAARRGEALDGRDAHEVGGARARRAPRAAPLVGSTWFDPVT